MALIARCNLDPGKFAWVKRGFTKDGKLRYGKVWAGEEFPYMGTRAELDACKYLSFVEGEEDAKPATPEAAAPSEPSRVPAPLPPKRRGRPPKKQLVAVPDDASLT